MNTNQIFIILVLISSIISSGIYEVYKEKQKLKEFEKSLENLVYFIHIKNAVKCIEENFENEEDKEFIEDITNYAIGNYHKQKSFLFKKYNRYEECIINNTHYYPNGKYKREYYY